MRSQLEDWELAGRNYSMLGGVESRELDVGGARVVLQFNPARVRSTAADVSSAAVTGRKCFLCAGNRPPEQEMVAFGDYGILVNPFPVFTSHLTVACREHVPQQIAGRMADMLSLAGSLKDFYIFYNGPESGASAPDHMHFQAVGKGDVRPDAGVGYERTAAYKDCVVYAGEDALRKMVLVEGERPEDVSECAYAVLEALRAVTCADGEARVNIFAWHDGRSYSVLIFPRGAHRPEEFFKAEGRVLFSPGAIDYAGVVITVRREDYERIDAPMLKRMFRQTTVADPVWDEFKIKLKELI